jgi:hypothetical protein
MCSTRRPLRLAGMQFVMIRSGSHMHTGTWDRRRKFQIHDLIFWLVAADYRISSMQRIKSWRRRKGVDEMRKLDQLNVERAAGRKGCFEDSRRAAALSTYSLSTNRKPMSEQRPDRNFGPCMRSNSVGCAGSVTWSGRMVAVSRRTCRITNLSTMRLVIRMCSKRSVKPSTMNETLGSVRGSQTFADLGTRPCRFWTLVNKIWPSVTLPIQITNTGNVVAEISPSAQARRVRKIGVGTSVFVVKRILTPLLLSTGVLYASHGCRRPPMAC